MKSTEEELLERGQLKGDTREDRLNSWFDHFKNLLDKVLTINNEDEVITKMFPNTDIDE